MTTNYEEDEETTRLKSHLGSEDLVKACQDEFTYALKTKTGDVFFFRSAKVIGLDWIHITLLHHSDLMGQVQPFTFCAERGVDIRISEIVWVIDAPFGS
jgi:hypothetical protein